MHLSEKLQLTLDELFASFDPQEIVTVHENIKQTINLMDSSGHNVLIFMTNKKIPFDSYLADKCLPLIRFYLAPNKLQQQTFLSKEKLSDLFTQIPTVESYLFKNVITLALHKIKSNHANTQNQESPIFAAPHYLRPLNRENNGALNARQNALPSDRNPKYLDCFYQVREGNLLIVNTQISDLQEILVYSELSPLQQLQAQKLCTARRNYISA